MPAGRQKHLHFRDLAFESRLVLRAFAPLSRGRMTGKFIKAEFENKFAFYGFSQV
jgi:hypothetical protein